MKFLKIAPKIIQNLQKREYIFLPKMAPFNMSHAITIDFLCFKRIICISHVVINVALNDLNDDDVSSGYIGFSHKLISHFLYMTPFVFMILLLLDAKKSCYYLEIILIIKCKFLKYQSCFSWLSCAKSCCDGHAHCMHDLFLGSIFSIFCCRFSARYNVSKHLGKHRSDVSALMIKGNLTSPHGCERNLNKVRSQMVSRYFIVIQ